MTFSSPTALTQLLRALQQHTREHALSQSEQGQVVQALAALLEDSAQGAAQQVPDVQEIRGQEHVKRALEVAAAGGHNILLVGPSGAGRGALARTLVSLLPKPSPLRIPQRRQELSALVGTTDPTSPGELTLVHEGVLLLEHLQAWKLAHLEAVQQAVERRVVSPVGGASVFLPARFMLVATAQPCPCGWYTDPTHECVCTVEQVLRYERRVSTFVRSSFDMYVDVPYARPEALRDTRAGEASAAIRQRVQEARAKQHKRFANTSYRVNADLRSLDEGYYQLDPAAEPLLKAAIQQLYLPAQQLLAIQKVARSIADLAESKSIAPQHLAEAIHYRSRIR